jgi:thiamine biosynthesis lipoprotein
MRKLSKKLIIILVLIAIIFLGLWGVRIYNTSTLNSISQTCFMMDTYVTIRIFDSSGNGYKIDQALNRMKDLDVKFNSLNPKSPIYAFNNYGVPVADPEILNVVRTALDISQKTDGAFDITIEPLIKLWGFYTESPHLPPPEQINETLKNVGYKHLLLRNGRLEKDDANIKIGLGAIAKGYIIGQAINVLKEQGVSSAIIDAGGDIYTLGGKEKKLWKVGIKNPRGEGLLGYVEVENTSIVGSGDYERFFMKNGKRYHHIFNPKTGYPSEGLTGITVIHPDPMLADGWATALFVLGPENGIEIANKLPDMGVIMVTTSGKVLYSSGLKNTMKANSETE